MAGQDSKIGRGLSKATLDVGPSRNKLAEIIEFITGIPTDPDWYKNASREEIFMNTVPQIAPAIMGTMGAVSKKIPDATKGMIARDPFGLAEGPMDRRVFIDKALGNTTNRAKKESDKLFNSPDYLNTDSGFQRAADFAEQFNTKYNYPNAVNQDRTKWINIRGDSSEKGLIFKYLENLMAGRR